MTKNDQIARVATIAALVLLSYAGLSFAQPRDNPIERARHHMELGQESFAKGSFEDAHKHFVDAYTASPFPAFLYNAGLAAQKGQDFELAAKMYRRYLDEEPNAPDAAEVEITIRGLLADQPTETLEGETSPGVPEVTIETEMKSLISVRTNPHNASIRILDKEGNEVSVFEGPAAHTVIRGTYTVEASHPDYRTVQTDINVTPGQVYIVVVEMSQGAFLGFLHIKTDVPGARVYVDDKEMGSMGTTPWGNVLPSGKHNIWVEKPGYETIETEVEIDIGDKQEIVLTMKRLQVGVLHVKANVSGSSVYLDGKFFGAAPVEEVTTPGQHKLKVIAEGMKDYETDVEISCGQTTKVLVRLNPKPSRTSAWVSMGFAVALFTGGGIAGGMALKIDDELDFDRNRGRLADDDPRILHGFLWALGADIAFGVGAIVTGMCIYYFLRDPLPPSEGKLYDPKDLTENPDLPGKTAKEQDSDDSDVVEPSQATHTAGPRILVAPLLTPDAAGLGLAVVF